MSLTTRLFSKSNSFRILLALIAVLVVTLSAFAIYALTDPYDCAIADNVSVGGLDIGGMGLSQAYRAVSDAEDAVLKHTVLNAELPQETLHLSPGDTKVSLRTLPLLLDAYKAGRRDTQTNTISLQPYLKLDEAYLRSVLSAYASRYDTDLTPSNYHVEGNMPDLSLAHSTGDCQTLLLTMGIPTTRLDQEDAFQQILSVYGNAFSSAYRETFTVSDFRVDTLEEPSLPDLDAIYRELYIAPVDDTLDMEQYNVVPGSRGYHFDMESAQKLIRKASAGEELSIPMEFIMPEISGDQVYFRDVLAYCETPHTTDENRNNNLRLACAAIDGMILQPGDTFSYNEALGPRTKERGYLKAGAYSGWELVMSYGGGICQVSSTLYCSTLYADLEIVSRVNHGSRVGYMPAGLDATVSWYGPDFQFRNNNHFPIKIAAEVSDGHVKITILGTDEKDYYIEMETEQAWGSTVLYTKTYKCKYDKQTGELISRELENRSNYAL